MSVSYFIFEDASVVEVDDLNQTRVVMEELTLRAGTLGNDDLTSEESEMDYVSKLVSVGFSGEIPESDVDWEDEDPGEEGELKEILSPKKNKKSRVCQN